MSTIIVDVNDNSECAEKRVARYGRSRKLSSFRVQYTFDMSTVVRLLAYLKLPQRKHFLIH